MKKSQMTPDDHSKSGHDLIACQDCDRLYPVQPLQPREMAKCARCGAVLYRSAESNINEMLALSIAALILFVIANVDPMMTLKIFGESSRCTIIGAVDIFAKVGYMELAILVLLLAFILPLVKLLLLIYILTPMALDRKAPNAASAMVLYQHIDEWGMLDIFMLGILVALTKIADIAHVELGMGLFAFIGLFITTVSISMTLDTHAIWKKL